ncbi:hypothetical protein F2Q69_00036276 [Brassica cretica]|uniref:Uncharacterized protein n=1 Tax=Brassica cretica TaxID=69181 RepID=A0A8S9SLL2_BRACR|nr:hypothetical protein F2Q69_00036276 [Brassica cretica]
MVYLLQKYCEIHGAIKILLLQTWKAAKPGTWWPASERQNAKSKQVPIVALPWKAEYGLCEKQNITGSQGTPGPYGTPDLKTKPTDLRKNPRVPRWPQGSKDKKEGRTSMQPKAHRGHYNIKNFRPRAHRGHYIPKNLQGPTAILGSIKESPVPIPPPGSSHDPMIYKRTSGSQIRPHGLGEPSGPEYDLRIQGELPGSSTTFESSDDPRVPTQPPGYVISLQTPRVHILA